MKISNEVKKIIIAAIIITAVAVIVWVIFIKKPVFLNRFLSQKAVSEPVVISSGFGGQLFDKIQQNLADKLPETNPFEKGLNPYEEAYTNPFE